MRDVLRLFCAILIASGGFVNILVWIKYNRIIRLSSNLPGKLPAYVKTVRHVSRIMMIFFMVGYAVGLADMLTNDHVPYVLYFVAVVFFVAALFVFLLIKYLGYVVDALSDYNDNLRREVESRVQELNYQASLLRATNETASHLLASDTGSFDDALWYCMGMIAGCVKVDRVYIWKNLMKDGELNCTRLCEWSEGSNLQEGKDNRMDLSYDRNIPGWDKRLSEGESIKGLVCNMNEKERSILCPRNVISIIIVPVFLKGEFWGFIGFDDCHRSRDFSEAEEGILRSASLLIAACMQRNDITLSLMEAKEVADRSSRTKSDFLSNMSHEIRTPINAIVGMSAIAKKADNFGKVRDCMKKIDAASRQLLGLINDILDMSKIEAGKMELMWECFDLHVALYNIKSIIDVRAVEKNIDFRLNIGEDLPTAVIGDEMRLSQILLNLLSNAVKFTPEGGSVTLDGELSGRSGEEYTLVFSVTDDGIGISPEQQKRLFTAFEQAERNTARKYGGTGLGLAISKRIAVLMGGDISLESEIGKGSCFTVCATLKAGDESMLKERLEGSKAPDDLLLGRTILLAEDVEINREIAVTLLGEKGAKVECAENGVQAVELFAAGRDRYDLILMDIQMPEMDGMTAARTIRSMRDERAKSIPILAMTANAFDDDVKRCLESGMNGHIAKPIDVQQLFKTLMKHLDG